MDAARGANGMPIHRQRRLGTRPGIRGTAWDPGIHRGRAMMPARQRAVVPKTWKPTERAAVASSRSWVASCRSAIVSRTCSAVAR